MSARAEVQQLMEESERTGASLTAPKVVEAAKDKDRFPRLHEYLWEVEEADLAQEARLARAHRLMISVVITTEAGVSTRLFVHTNGSEGYRSLDTVVNSKDLAAIKLQELTQDIGRARARLRAFRAALPDPVADEIDEALRAAEQRASEAAAERGPVTTG